MKVTKNNETNFFKPYTFTVTVETEEEDKILNSILKLNITIPDLLKDHGFRFQSVVDLMNQIRTTIQL